MRIRRDLTFFHSFCLTFVLLQVLALLSFFANEQVGYFATLFISTVFCVVLIFTSDPFVDGAKPSSQLLLVANVWIGLFILIVGPVKTRDLGSYKREGWLLLFGVICMIASWSVIYLKERAAQAGPPRPFIPYESQKLILIFVFLAVISVMLHYNISYEAAEYGQRAGINFERNFLIHLSTMGSCLLGIVITVISLRWRRAKTRTRSNPERPGAFRKIIQDQSLWLVILGEVVVLCIAFAAFLKRTGGRYPSVPLNVLYLALPLGAAVLANGKFHKSVKHLRLFIGTGFLASLGALYVDKGVGIAILFIFILLAICAFFTHQIHNRDNDGNVAKRPWLWPVLSVVVFFLVPLLVFVVLNFNLGGKIIQERALIMFYPAQTKEADFATQMFAAQVLMRDAVRYGGIMGDGFWHNPFELPQLNSDIILGPTFFYFGLFGYCILALIAGFIAQLGRMITRKDLDGDRDRALRFINFGFGTVLVIAIPALWLLGAISLKLPLTGVVFPFLARGAYFQGCLGLLLILVVFFDRRSYDRESRPNTNASMGQRMAAWIGRWRTEPLALVRMVRGTLFCLVIFGLYYGFSFAKLVHFPVLAGQEGNQKYIVIPDNDNQEYFLDLSPGAVSGGFQQNGGPYRIGNTIVETEIPTIGEAMYSDPFVYISGYSFNRDEAYQGITIGRSGQLSPVLDLSLPLLNYKYADKRNDIILFWEDGISKQAHLTLKPEKGRIKFILGSDSPDDPRSAVGVYRLQNGKWPPVQDGELLESDSRIKVGSTVMQVSLSNEPQDFLTIVLEPERTARASFLHSRQGEEFVLSRTRTNVLGGLQLAVKDIDAARLSNTPWASRFRNQFEGRATIRDCRGRELMRYDPNRAGAWYGDPNLFFTIGSHQRIQAGLDYTFDPILSGKLGTDAFSSVLNTTIRSIVKEQVKGQNVYLSYDLNLQRAVTQTVDTFLSGRNIQSASAIILSGSNEILATAQYTNRQDAKLRFQTGPDGFFLPFDSGFASVWQNINSRPPEADLYANPLLRRPLCDAFKTDLIGSTIKGILYMAALSDDAHGQHSHFLFGPSLETSYIRAIEGDRANTILKGEERVFGAIRELRPFAEYDFDPVENDYRGSINTNLYDAFRQSSNTASCYLALRLNSAGRLEFALRRFMFENPLLLRSPAFEQGLNSSRYVRAEVTRYADNFNRSNASDVLRIGLGDKIYLSLLHLATFYSTVLINDGKFIHPTIVQRIGEGESISKQSYDILDKEDKASVIPKMRVLAQQVLLNGTGKSFSKSLLSSGVEFIGGKTGTASLPGGQGREHKIFVACIKVNGKPFTIACRVNNVPTGTNVAIELAAQIVRNALLVSTSSN